MPPCRSNGVESPIRARSSRALLHLPALLLPSTGREGGGRGPTSSRADGRGRGSGCGAGPPRRARVGARRRRSYPGDRDRGGRGPRPRPGSPSMSASMAMTMRCTAGPSSSPVGAAAVCRSYQLQFSSTDVDGRYLVDAPLGEDGVWELRIVSRDPEAELTLDYDPSDPDRFSVSYRGRPWIRHRAPSSPGHSPDAARWDSSPS